MYRLSPRHGLESKESPSPTEINAICSSPSIFDQETISNGPGNSESNKIKAMREVLLEFKAIAGLVPDYFFTTLHDYFESTVLEAENQFELRWPSHAELETVKEDSSGSLHAIAAGAAVKRLDMAQLLENLTLKYIGRYSAKAVESHNDVNSHSKEIRQRLKKLVTLFNELDGRYTEFQPFLEAEVKTEDPSLYYLVKAYKAIAKINASVDVKKDPPNKLLLKYLEILPSFNRVDLYHHAGKSFAESYSLVAERGNESILEMTRRIKAHDAAIKVNSLVIPKGFRENRAEFIRQSHVWISICEGWGSQNIWEWEARRYNEGLVEMGGTSFVDKISWLKDQLEEPK